MSKQIITKTDLANDIADEVGISKRSASDILDTVLGHIASYLSKGAKVQIPGFGSWETQVRKARTGRNPRTGDVINIEESVAISFKAGSKLKLAVNSPAPKKKKK